MRFGMMLVMANLLFLGFVLLLQRFFIRPLQEIGGYVLQVPSLLEETIAVEGREKDLLQQARAIQKLLVEYFHTKEEATNYRHNLTQAVRLMHRMHEEQMGFLNAVSIEMEEVFNASIITPATRKGSWGNIAARKKYSSRI
jgi:hypothetical protein